MSIQLLVDIIIRLFYYLHACAVLFLAITMELSRRYMYQGSHDQGK